MQELFTTVNCLVSDKYLFYLLQFLLLATALLAFCSELLFKWRAGKGGAKLKVTRSDESVALFYGAYLAISGIFVALSLTANVASNHTVFWTVLDVALVAYLCILNPWTRNKLVEMSIKLREIEKR